MVQNFRHISMANTATNNRSYELKKLKAECVAEENKKYIISQRIRKTGSFAAENGNLMPKITHSPVYIYIAGNATDSQTIQTQFKNTKNFKKTKAFASVSDVLKYLKDAKHPNNSIVILCYIADDTASQETQQKELDNIALIKEKDPVLDIMMITTNAYANTGVCDFVIQKNSDEMFGKIITNLSWAIREQDRIRKQVESKQFIKIAIIAFFVFLVAMFAIDLITGLLNPMRQGVLGIVPIPQE